VIPHFPGTESYERGKAAQQALRESEEIDRILEQQQREKDEKTVIEAKKALLAYVGGNLHEEDPEPALEPQQPTTPDNTDGQVEVGGRRAESGNGQVEGSSDGGVHDGVSRAKMVEAMGGQGEMVMPDGRKEVVDEPPHVHVGDAQVPNEVLESEDVGMMGMEMGF
jgi:hypothetical protein